MRTEKEAADLGPSYDSPAEPALSSVSLTGPSSNHGASTPVPEKRISPLTSIPEWLYFLNQTISAGRSFSTGAPMSAVAPSLGRRQFGALSASEGWLNRYPVAHPIPVSK